MNDGPGINFWTGSPQEDPIRNTRIYGNTIYSVNGPAIVLWPEEGIYDTKVHNNLFITANGQKLVAGNTNKSTVIFVCNAYWADDGKYDFAGYKSLEEWRKATGQEMLNGKPVGIVINPQVTGLGSNVTVGDPTKLCNLTAYRLQKSSPLIDAGLDLRSLFGIDPGDRDFFGNSIPQGKGYDIGTHEIAL